MTRRLLVAATAAGGATVVGTFLPWLRSGARWRSSYELLGLIDRLGIARGPGAWLLRWWPTVPLVVTLAVVAAWARARRLAPLLSLTAAAAALHVAVVVRDAAERVAMRTGSGLWVTPPAAVLFACCCAAWAWSARGADRSGPAGAHSVRSPHADAR
jgi:hypothetical protein